jgi:hypothetical protein
VQSAQKDSHLAVDQLLLSLFKSSQRPACAELEKIDVIDDTG